MHVLNLPSSFLVARSRLEVRGEQGDPTPMIARFFGRSAGELGELHNSLEAASD